MCLPIQVRRDPSGSFYPFSGLYTTYSFSFRITLNALDADKFIFAEVKVVSNDSEGDYKPVNGTKATPIGRLCIDHQIAKLSMSCIALNVNESQESLLIGADGPSKTTKRQLQDGAASHRFISLKDFLEPSSSSYARSRTGLGEGSRKLLLARVSPYALMLESTPWRSEVWRTEDIEFLLEADRASPTSDDFRRPFVSYFPHLCQR